MSKKVGDYKIPFTNHNGILHMMEYAGAWYEKSVVEQRENKPFAANLKLIGHYRGRSAARIKVRNVHNNEVYSFGLAAFYDAISALEVQDGIIIGGTWMFRKQGANYGLVHVPWPKE